MSTTPNGLGHVTPCAMFRLSVGPSIWLLEEGLIDDEAGQQFAAEHPDTDLP